jgi:hypothetical protein
VGALRVSDKRLPHSWSRAVDSVCVWTTGWYRPWKSLTTQEVGDKSQVTSQGGKLDVRRAREQSPFSTAVTSCHYGLQGDTPSMVSGMSKLPPELSRKVLSQHYVTTKLSCTSDYISEGRQG